MQCGALHHRSAHMKPLFLIPGQGETLRVNGRCLLNNDPELCEELVVNGKTPRVVLVVSVESVCTGTWSRPAATNSRRTRCFT